MSKIKTLLYIIMKFPQATSSVKWLKGEKTFSKTISVLVLKALIWLEIQPVISIPA
jgi:hypothetical protein